MRAITISTRPLVCAVAAALLASVAMLGFAPAAANGNYVVQQCGTGGGKPPAATSRLAVSASGRSTRTTSAGPGAATAGSRSERTQRPGRLERLVRQRRSGDELQGRARERPLQHRRRLRSGERRLERWGGGLPGRGPPIRNRGARRHHAARSAAGLLAERRLPVGRRSSGAARRLCLCQQHPPRGR